MASDNSRYFIIRDMSLLPSLSSIFSKGSCQSLGIDMSSMVIISPTEEPMSLTSDNLEKQVAGCQSIILNVTHYEEVRMIPGFGSLKQVLACPRNQFYDVTRCGCS
ncbi:hypothetical protein SNE40_018642 [Patella caerulea]|uniref:Uncharacterized protein n=1 Tax=Patella caerulea TaxID=87958 RepID=A0AAN8P8A2_PATCE